MMMVAFRKLDQLGRVVLPLELRRQLGIEPGTEVEILAEGGDIVVRRWVPRCVICRGPGEGQVMRCVGSAALLRSGK